ncbi:MAG: FHA domain-containing protein [Myxococcota bacterium]|nr:FHA domain-containing protein [Myxococcota bacterium]
MGVRLLVRSCWAARAAGGEGGSVDDAVYEFDQSRVVIGRGRGADVRLPHRAVSVRHASIELDGTRYVVVDHGATNGTRVQGVRIVPDRPKPLRDGDRIEVGGFAIHFQSGVTTTRSTSAEKTSSLARRLARETLPIEETLEPFVAILNGPREGEVFTLPPAPARVRIGRGEECELCLPDSDASREHAELEVGLDGVVVRDLGSKNGVLFGQRKVTERILSDRDELQIGQTVLRFEDPAAAHVEALESVEDEAVEPPSWEEIAPPPPPEPADPDDAEAPILGDTEPAPIAIRPPPKRGVSTADMVIYVLASVVFAVSVMGLIWLLSSG